MSTIVFHNKYKKDWMRAFPLGNGRIGAMLYGCPHKETLEINEESLWSGKQLEEKYLSSPENLQKIRELLFNEEYEKAEELCTSTLLATPPRVRFFESFGEIFLDFDDKSQYTNYRKELDLSKAIATVSYEKNGIYYKSESFISEEYDCLVYRIKSKGGSFNCTVTMNREQDAETIATNESTLLLSGQITCPSHEFYGEGFKGMCFGAHIDISSNGKSHYNKSKVFIENATEIKIIASFSTTYNVKKFDFDNSIDYKKQNAHIIEKAKNACYEDIKEKHISYHQSLFNKVELSIEEDTFSSIPTDERIRKVQKENVTDIGLFVLYYNFGRYLLLESSAKKATLPANLQGLWCNGFTPPWGSDYHTNINLQMNYWCADNTNMSNAFEPFSNYVKMLSIFGKETAKRLFNASGWVCNHTSDIFGRTGVHDSVKCGFFPMAAPWLCLNLFEHYEYKNDKKYLEEIYPILKDSCLFILDFLVEKDGCLQTAPSNSPENYFHYEKNGEKKTSMFTYGATMDFEIIYALFTRTAYACRILSDDNNFALSLEKALAKLPPIKISKRYGTICEWIKDYEEAEPGHRHISHLFGLYPSDQITENDKTLYDAAKRTIERRLCHGGAQTGWSRAWVINFYARLKNGNEAEEHLKQLLKISTAENLFDMHPPFQIDGNFGAVAGITEMLLQSHKGKPDSRIIEILPALPSKWRYGYIKGIKARGGFVFDIYWKNSQAYKVSVTSETPNTLMIKLPQQSFKTSKEHSLFEDILTFSMEKDENIEILF